MEFVVNHEFDCDTDTLWKLQFHEEYQKAMYSHLGIHDVRVLEYHPPDDKNNAFRAQRIVPEEDVPAVVRKVAGDKLAYIERSTFDRASSTITVDIEVDVDAVRKRFEMRGKLTIQELSPGRIRREFRADVKVKIPLVGGRIEKVLAENLRRNYENEAGFTRHWIAGHR